jgi:hypothetical protein
VIQFKGDKVTTLAGESEAEANVGIDLGVGAFHSDNLRPMLACATKMAITEQAAIFEGENFKGVMSLLRV